MKPLALATFKIALATSGIALGVTVVSSLPQLLIQLTYELGWNVAAPM